jgi:hypothetical protein
MRIQLISVLASLACLSAAWSTGCTRSDEPAPSAAPAQPAQPAQPAPAAPQPPKESPTLQQPIEWKEFTPLQAGFKLRFPRLPERREQKEDSPDGPVSVVAFVSLAPEHDGAYSLAVTEFPQATIDKTSEAEYWDRSTEILVHNTFGNVLEQKVIDVQGKPGRELRITGTGPKGRTTFFARIIRAGNRTFQMFAAFPEGKENLEFARRYLDSFQFID